MEIFTLFPCVSNPFSFLWLYRKKAENPTLPFWPETSHFRQIFPAFRFCLIFSWSLKLFLAKERLCFLCLTTPFSKIFLLCSCGFSAIFSLTASEHEPAIISGAVMHWIASTFCRKWHLRGTYFKNYPREACPWTP